MRARDPPAAEVTDHLPGVAGLSSTTYPAGHRARDDIAAALWLAIISLGVMLLLARNSLSIISVLLNGGLLFLVLHYGSAELQSIAAYGSSGFMLLSGVR
jgi:hypothetical protein